MTMDPGQQAYDFRVIKVHIGEVNWGRECTGGWPDVSSWDIRGSMLASGISSAQFAYKALYTL